MKRRTTLKTSGRTSSRVGRWAAAVCLVLWGIGWVSPASAATPAWWDCNYGYRKKITVSAVSAVPVDYTVSVTFDHAALVTAGKSLSSGNDIRVLYWNGSTWVELDRVLDDDSAWNNASTTIFFKLQAAIASSSSDNNYYVYYGNPSALSPPAIPNNVFWYFNDFSSPTALNDFTQRNVGAPSVWGVSGGILGGIIGSYTATQPEVNGKLVLTAKPTIRDLHVEYQFRETDNDLAGVGLCTNDTNNAGFYVGHTRDNWYVGQGTQDRAGYWVSGADTNFGLKSSINNVWYEVKAQWTNSTLSIWFDGIPVGTWSTGPASANYFCLHGESHSGVQFDDLTVRLFVDPEPTTALGGEEVQDCAPPPPTFCQWQSCKKITIDHTKVAATLTDFPVLISLTDADLAAKAQSNGNDILFTAADKITQLSHEIETFDGTTGELVAWVKVPTLSSTTDTVIYMCYGNPTAPNQQDVPGTWEPNFQTVWHMDGAGTMITDSTSNNNNGSLPASWSWDATGRIARGLNFQALDVNGDDVSSGIGAGKDFTLEFWYQGDVPPPTSKGWDDHFVVYAAPWDGLAIGNFGDPPGAYIDWTSYGGCCRGPFTTNYGQTGADWYTLTLDWDGAGAGTARLRLYKNGAFQATYDLLQPAFPSTIRLGNPNWNTYQAGTSIDEFRVATTVRSDTWIQTEYNNQSSPSTFYTVSPEEANGTSISYFTPDAAAAGMSIPVTFVGSICAAPTTLTTSSPDIIVAPLILTDATGAVVTQNGNVLSTTFFVKPAARPTTGITVTLDGQALAQTFDIVIPAPDPNVTSGTATLSGRSSRGTSVLGGLTVAAGATLTINTTDTDGSTSGNQGYLPAMILVKGDVNIAGTLDVSGQDGANAGASGTGGDGGTGGPGGGGGGGGGVAGGSSSSPPVIDAVSTKTGTGSSITISHTTSGSDRLMLVVPQWNSGGGSSGIKNVTGVTYNGVPLTLVGHIENVDDAAVDIWQLVAPPTGTYNVVISYDQAPVYAHIAAVITFTGVDQTTPLGAFTSAKATSTSASVDVSSAPGELVLGAVTTEQIATLTLGSGQTVQWDISVGSGNRTHAAGSTEAGAATVTTSWTFSTSDHWVIAGVSIKPAPGAGGTAAPGAAGRSGGGGGGSKGTGTGGAGGDGTGAAGSSASGPTGGAGGVALAGASGGGGGMPNTEVSGGDGGGGGTGDPLGAGGSGANTDGAPGGEGGGGGGASGNSPGGGGGGGFATAGTRASATEPDSGFGGNVTGNAQLVPLAGGSGGAGGGPDVDITSVHRGGGGGGGGGAVLLYSTGSVTITGMITANGGNGGNGYTSGTDGSGAGGGGSGGAILVQSGDVTLSGTLTTAGGTGGTSNTADAGGGAGGTGRIRIDGLAASATVPGTAGSKFIGPVIDSLVGTTVTGRADGASTVTLYAYDDTGAQVTGSPYATTASGSTGTVGTWSIAGVTFPAGTGYLAVKQSAAGGGEVFGPGRGTRGVHLIQWREVY